LLYDFFFIAIGRVVKQTYIFYQTETFPKNSGVGGVNTRVKTPLLYPHQGYLAKTGLIQQSYRGYFQATTP
jgi:hypothetical protein